MIVAWLRAASPVIVTLATNGLVEGGLLAYEHGTSPPKTSPMPITHWVYDQGLGPELRTASCGSWPRLSWPCCLRRTQRPGFRHLATGGNRIAAVLSGNPSTCDPMSGGRIRRLLGSMPRLRASCALGASRSLALGMGDPFIFEAVAGALLEGWLRWRRRQLRGLPGRRTVYRDLKPVHVGVECFCRRGRSHLRWSDPVRLGRIRFNRHTGNIDEEHWTQDGGS